MSRWPLAASLSSLLLAATCPRALAQAWPTKQAIRLVSPFVAGAAPETIGRPVFEHVSKQLGQSVVWENRTGAGGTIGMQAVAKAEPDGYTLLVNSSAHTVVPAIYSNLRFDVLKDLTTLAALGELPVVLIVPTARYKTLRDMVAAGKANPGSLTYGSAGVGSGSHLIAEKFRLSAGFTAAHVPFKGAPEVSREIVGNRLDFAFSNLGNALQLIDTGELRALAVAGPRRATARADLPTTVEAGYPNSDSVFWIGAFAPAGTPGEIVQRLQRAISAAVADPALKDTLGKLGAEPMPLTPAAFDALVKAEVESNAALVKAAGIKVN